MEFRERTIESFAVVFDGQVEESNSDNGNMIATDETFSKRWGWFGVMYRLTNGDISRLGQIVGMELYTCLTWLSYEIDLESVTKNKRANARK